MIPTLKISRFLSLIIISALATSCSSMYLTVDYDDVYGGVPTRAEERQAEFEAKQRDLAQQTPNNTTSYSYYQDADSSYYYAEEIDTAVYEYPEFEYDDYYDYEYSSRIRRFDQEFYIADGYYDDYYTNNYWYDNNPYLYGSSIYLGYNWWYPSYSYYRPGWYSGLAWSPFAWGWSGYGLGYWNGYNNGYWNGYWDGNHYGNSDYCYNPYDKNTYHHSEFRRGYAGGSSTVTPNTGSGAKLSPVRDLSFAQKYELSVNKGTIRENTTPVTKPATGGSAIRVNPNSSFEQLVSNRLESQVVRTNENSKNPTTNPVRPGSGTSSAVRVNPNNPTAVRPNANTSAPVRQNPNNPTSVRPSSNTAPVRQNPNNPTSVRPSSNTAPVRQNPNNPTSVRSSSNTAPVRQNPNTTVRPSTYVSPSYGGNNSSSYRSPQYQRQTSPNVYRNSNTARKEVYTPSPTRSSNSSSYNRSSNSSNSRSSSSYSTSSPSKSSSSTTRSTSSGSSSGSSSSNSGSSGGSTRRR